MFPIIITYCKNCAKRPQNELNLQHRKIFFKSNMKRRTVFRLHLILDGGEEIRNVRGRQFFRVQRYNTLCLGSAQ